MKNVDNRTVDDTLLFLNSIIFMNICQFIMNEIVRREDNPFLCINNTNFYKHYSKDP